MKSTLLYGGSAENADERAMTRGKFIGRLFHAVTAAHMLHLGSKNGTHHDALGKLYEDLLDSADELAEVYQGCTGQLLEFVSCPFVPPTDAQAWIAELYECVEQNRLVMGTEFHIQDLVGDVISDIARAKYKLTFLS